jgi:hypothetical protein
MTTIDHARRDILRAKLRAHITSTGLSQVQWAKTVIYRNPATVRRWLAGKNPIPPLIITLLRLED